MREVTLNGYDTILVTGGLGFIGRHLVNTLVERYPGKEIRVLDNGSVSVGNAVSAGARFYHGDITDTEGFDYAFRDVDLVFHTAGNACGTLSVLDPVRDMRANVEGTINVLKTSVNAGIKRFVHSGSASVYGKSFVPNAPEFAPIKESDFGKTQPVLPYGISKYASCQYVNAFESMYPALDAVIAHYFCVWGPGENPKTAMVEPTRYLRWTLNHQKIREVGDMDLKKRDFPHVSDVVQGLLILAERGKSGEHYNIGCGETISMHQLAWRVRRATGRKIKSSLKEDVMEDSYTLSADISKIESLGYVAKVLPSNVSRGGMRDKLKEIADELGEYPELPGTETIFAPHQAST